MIEENVGSESIVARPEGFNKMLEVYIYSRGRG